MKLKIENNVICEKKVLQNGCKYPQNSSTSLFSLHYQLNGQSRLQNCLSFFTYFLRSCQTFKDFRLDKSQNDFRLDKSQNDFRLDNKSQNDF